MASMSPFGVPGVTTGIIHPIRTERTDVELIGGTDENYNSFSYRLACNQLSSFAIDYANDNIMMTFDSMLPHPQCDDFEAVIRMVIQNLSQVKFHILDGGVNEQLSFQQLCFDGGVISHRCPRGPILDYPILQHEVVFVFDTMRITHFHMSHDAATGTWVKATERTSEEPKIDTQELSQTPVE
ncbi:hypothetical protein E4H12_06305 [Candidatus Thorarchaeota archaeon]|nr:MAG: hypothetical protein E4H12_06305 [Candidatus Thorarchaeota archaeon]